MQKDRERRTSPLRNAASLKRTAVWCIFLRKNDVFITIFIKRIHHTSEGACLLRMEIKMRKADPEIPFRATCLERAVEEARKKEKDAVAKDAR